MSLPTIHEDGHVTPRHAYSPLHPASGVDNGSLSAQADDSRGHEDPGIGKNYWVGESLDSADVEQEGDDEAAAPDDGSEEVTDGESETDGGGDEAVEETAPDGSVETGADEGGGEGGAGPEADEGQGQDLTEPGPADIPRFPETPAPADAPVAAPAAAPDESAPKEG